MSHSGKRYLALACDYDGTLATDGRVPPPVIEALQHLRRSGRRLLLVTGRELDDLRRISPRAGANAWTVGPGISSCRVKAAAEPAAGGPPAELREFEKSTATVSAERDTMVARIAALSVVPKKFPRTSIGADAVIWRRSRSSRLNADLRIAS
jgi:hypothetical protein